MKQREQHHEQNFYSKSFEKIKNIFTILNLIFYKFSNFNHTPDSDDKTATFGLNLIVFGVFSFARTRKFNKI
jgi:hypothetical protein